MTRVVPNPPHAPRRTGRAARRAPASFPQDLAADPQVLPAIVALGMATPLGADAATTWGRLLRGEHITACGHVPGAASSGGGRVKALARRAVEDALRTGRRGRFGDHVLEELSRRDAALALDDLRAADTALVVGTSKGTVDDWLAALAPGARDDAPPGLAPAGVAEIADHLAAAFGMTGPRLTLSAACASGLHALVRAAMMVRAGEVRRAVVVAAESSMHPLFGACFARLGVLAPDGVGCRPFDRARAGFPISEAAAAVVLEGVTADELARRRGGGDASGVPVTGGPASPAAPTVVVVVDRFALAGDATHLTGSDPDGRALRRMLARAIDGRPVDLVHAHGTGTPLNDEIELAALDAVVADGVPPIVYSHKGALGHSLGASGLLSVVINCLCHAEGVVPPSPQTRDPLPAGRVTVATGRGVTRRAVRRSLAVAAGFGGAMAAVSLRSV